MSGENEMVPATAPERAGSLLSMGAMTVEDVVSQVNLIHQLMKKVMLDKVHYGLIPGCGDKPALFKAGAEKLCFMFRMDPQYEVKKEYSADGHLTIESKCTLFHISSGQRLGSGMGSCSTKEAKYAYRKGGRKCPTCGKEAIIKGRQEYGGGWLCFEKKGGCKAKFPDGDDAIESQNMDRVANEDLADQYNTVLKMSNKRSLLAAVLNVTAASDIFAQAPLDEDDEETYTDPEEGGAPKKPPMTPPGKKTNGGSHAPAAGGRSAVVSQSQVGRLYALARGAGKSEADVHDYLGEVYGLNSAKEIEGDTYESIVKWAQDPKTTRAGEPGSRG